MIFKRPILKLPLLPKAERERERERKKSKVKSVDVIGQLSSTGLVSVFPSILILPCNPIKVYNLLFNIRLTGKKEFSNLKKKYLV